MYTWWRLDVQSFKYWRALTRFLKNPYIAIDNNETERAIKCWVLVRKNSLFAGSDAGAKAIAIHLSFVGTAKRNGINLVDWYADVLARINGLKTTELQQLLLRTGLHLNDCNLLAGHVLRKSDWRSFRYHVNDRTDTTKEALASF